LWTKEDSEEVLNDLGSAFREKPHRFFNEPDLHSRLYNIVEEKLEQKGELFAITKDGLTASLVHHEYPTPFRCDMRDKGFSIVGEPDRIQKRSLHKREHYDLVVLNPDFIKKFDAIVVAGKNYKRFCEEKEKIEVSPVQWACEIRFAAFVENNLPVDWKENVFQDVEKIIASLNYKVGKADFAANGSVMVFIGIKPDCGIKQLEKQLHQFGLGRNFPIKVQTA